MNRKLILQGSAGEALGEEWSVNAPTIGDAFSIVRANKPEEFMEYFGRDDAQGEFSVKLAGEALEEAELVLLNLGEGDIVVTPMPKGSKMNAVEKIITAVVLIVIAYYMPELFVNMVDVESKFFLFAQSTMMMMGINLALAGITELMTKEPSKDKDDQGAMFGGPANTIKNGLPVPMAYGKVLVGGTPINFGFGAWKLEPANGFVFSSDNPKAWDGVVYDPSGNVASDSNVNDGRGARNGGSGDQSDEHASDHDAR